MKSPRRFTSLIALTAVTLSINPIAYSAGRTQSAVVNTILNGKGAPKSSLGIDGDFYIDTRSLLLYGPKAKGKWPLPQSLQGPTGPAGSDGKNGSDGRAGVSNVSSVTGAQGPAGPQGEKGEKGDPGAAGPSGAPGPSGPAGGSGAPGPSGPAGATGPAGPSGATGATGPQGPKGETGTAGASEVTVVTVPQTTLGTSIAYTFVTTNTFGVLKANTAYKFEIYLRADSNTVGLVLGVDLIAAGGTINFSYIRSDSRLATLSSSPAGYGFQIIGTIEVGGADSALAVKIIDAYGDTGANPLTFSGKAYITQVGAIK